MTIPTGSTLLLIRALMAGEFEKYSVLFREDCIINQQNHNRHFRDPSSIMRSNCIASKLVVLEKKS